MIHSPKGDKVYIGATIRSLHERFIEHKKQYRTMATRVTSFKLFEEYGIENCVITLLEECKDNMAERERYHVENTPNVVNRRIPNQSRKESALRWYYKNKSKTPPSPCVPKEKYDSAKKISCECGSIYRLSNRYQHLKTNRHSQYIISTQ